MLENSGDIRYNEKNFCAIQFRAERGLMANDKAAFDIRTMRIGTGITYGKPASIPGKTSTYEKHRIRKKPYFSR